MMGFSWIIENELAGMPLPGMMADLESDLAELVAVGVGAVVSLTEQPLDIQGQQRLDVLHVPIQDMTPPSILDVEEVVAFAETAIQKGKPVAIHCLAGRGRTGTMLACFLVHRGTEPQRAIEAIRALRPGSIETETQVMAVFDYAAYLADQNETRQGSGIRFQELN
ncbi:MAG: dual specificity protein phosphatase family protein [bacterium]|nr:dual specificity protein phosphatase family protein [bacterium]